MGVELNLSYRIGGDDKCEHTQLSYLGQMGPTAMYNCDRCGGVLTTSE
jgi:hypothetical protein